MKFRITSYAPWEGYNALPQQSITNPYRLEKWEPMKQQWTHLGWFPTEAAAREYAQIHKLYHTPKALPIEFEL